MQPSKMHWTAWELNGHNECCIKVFMISNKFSQCGMTWEGQNPVLFLITRLSGILGSIQSHHSVLKCVRHNVQSAGYYCKTNSAMLHWHPKHPIVVVRVRYSVRTYFWEKKGKWYLHKSISKSIKVWYRSYNTKFRKPHLVPFILIPTASSLVELYILFSHILLYKGEVFFWVNP